jgi:spore germination protein
VLDDITLVEAIGFDYAGKNKTEGTILFPVYLPNQPPKNETYSSKALIKKTILQDIQRQVPDPIVTGSIEIILFGSELAEKEGVLELVDAFQRDPGVGSRIFIVTVDGTAKELLEGNYGVRGTATNLSRLIEHNIKQEDVPKTNLQKFLFEYYQDGRTPFLPQLKQIENDKVELNGISLFKFGKTIDFIPPEKMFFFKLLVDKYSEGLHRVEIKEGEAAIRSIRSSHKFKLTNRNPMEVDINIELEGIINEFTGNRLTVAIKNKLQKKFEREINEECMKLIKEFMDKQIDPVGFGHFVKTQTRNFDFKKWNEEQYPKLVVNIHSNVKINEAGVIE